MRQEVRDNWRQAQEDLTSARVLQEGKRYYGCVFFCQQAAEKAFKTLYVASLSRSPVTHNLIELSRDLEAPGAVLTAARELTPNYLTSRCVDAANGVPADMYDERSAEIHISFSEEVLAWVAQKIGVCS